MQAAYYERTGPAREVLHVAELPEPEPGPGEVRVRLRWSGVNPSDVKSRAGLRSTVLPFPRIVPHSDGMGLIDAVGAGVPPGRVGERVWLWNAAWGRAHGTAAQRIVLPQQQAVPLPEGVPDEAGACLGIPAMTALHALLCAGGVAGQTVLVAGGAGAVGHYAVQMARLLGAARVLATASTPAKAAAGTTGIHRIVEVDIAANAALDLDVLRPGGDCVVYGSGAPAFTLPFFPLIARNLALRFFIVYNLEPADRQRAQATLGGWLERGALVHAIAERWPLAQVAQAHESVESGRAVGNVVLSLE